MSSFKSWLVANIEVILIIVTVLLIIVLGLTALLSPTEEKDLQFQRLFYWAITSIVLCVFVVFFVRRGLLSLVILGIVVTLIIIEAKKQSHENQSSNNNITEQVQSKEDNEPNSDTILLDLAAERFKGSWLIWLSIPALAFGIFTSFYANRNFEDVVSRRFLYRNSCVSVFEQRWLYTFNRLYAGFMTVFTVSLEIYLYILLRP